MNTAMQTPTTTNVVAAAAAAAPDVDRALARAESYLNAGLVAPAAELFEAILGVEGFEDSIQARHGLARCAFARGELHSALGHLQMLMQKDATSAEVINDVGVVYYRLGLMDLAKEQLERSVSLAPEDGLARRNLVDVAYACGDLDTCLAQAEILQAQEPTPELAQIIEMVQAERAAG